MQLVAIPLDSAPVPLNSDISDAQEANVLNILFDRMPMGIALLDRELCLRRFNPTWVEFVERYTATAPGSVKPGMRFFDVVKGAEPTLRPLMEAALKGQTVRREGVRMECAGIVSYWDQVYSPLVKNGQVIGLVDVCTDATERVLTYQTLERRVEERTREIEARRRVAEGMRDILNVLNSEQPLEDILNFIVEQACHLLDTDTGAIYRLEPEKGLLTIQCWKGLSEEYVNTVSIPVGQGVVGRAVESRAPVVVHDMLDFFKDNYNMPPDEARRVQITRLAHSYGAILAVPLVIKDQVYGGITLYYPRPRRFTSDDVDLARTFGDQAALALENARLRSQAQETAVAAERSRLARDLHDSVTQTLFSASLIAEVLPKLWERNQEEGRRRLEELRQLARGALAEMRTLLLELRPAALVEAELCDLIKQLTEAVAGRARVPVQLSIEGHRENHRQLPADAQLAFYRIVQEALNNIVRHAHATKAEVRVTFTEKRLELEVGDNGQGFDPALVQAEHLGLGIMRERAEAVGATLTVCSTPGKGTRIKMHWEYR